MHSRFWPPSRSPAPGAAAAERPYDKTFIGSAKVCFLRTQQCTAETPIHVYLSTSGRLYSFLRDSGGQVFTLGQFISVGGVQERFVVRGNTLVFEAVSTDQNGSRLTLRGLLRSQGGACVVSATADRDGTPEPIQAEASCEVYEGRK